MKKFGFFALLAAVLLVGCKPENPTETVVNSIKLNETSVTLALGGDIKLIATVDPASAEVTWESNAPEVATVNAKSGLVQAVAEGEAVITAKAGDKTATCHVTVAADAAYDYFDIADYGLFGNATPVAGAAPYHTKLTNGDSVRCVLSYFTVYAWDANVQWVSGEGFVGDGLVIDLGDVPFWVIEEDYTNSAFNGYYLGEGGVFVYNTKSIEPAFAKPGHIDVETYGDFVQAQYSADLEADFETMQAKTNGALLSLCTADDGFEGWYGLYYAAINRLVILDGEEEGDPLSVAADVTWCRYTSDDRLYGFAVDMDVYEAEKKIQLVTPYDYATVNKVYDEYELFDRFEAYYGAEGENILATSAKKIGTRYMSKEMPTRNGKALDNKTLHMAR